MGIVNVTPDSFSDGGRFHEVERAVAHAEELLAEGADILDIGGESTRPGATPVPLDEERRRVEPVLRRLAGRSHGIISIDTMKPAIARLALDLGASIINDVSGFRDPEMVAVAAASDCGLVVMHMPGTPTTMNSLAHYEDILPEVRDYLAGQSEVLQSAGISPERIAWDPGIGFGKMTDHSLTLIARLSGLADAGHPVLLGVSRKGFLGRITGRETQDRMPASVAVACYSTIQGSAHILRVHDVGPTLDAVKVLQALRQAERPGLC
jgi:dihydropteroate synthase